MNEAFKEKHISKFLEKGIKGNITSLHLKENLDIDEKNCTKIWEKKNKIKKDL